MPRYLSRSFSWIGLILLVSFLIRLPGVPYGLPYHLIGDEEASVYGALQMIHLHTLLPVLHPGAFTVLYEPPFLATIYAIVFLPVLAVTYIVWGAPGIPAFTAMLTLDPSVLWYTGRTLGILFSLGSIYVLYRLGWSLFRNKTVGLFAALFLATSYLSTTIASATRQWTPGTFTSILALWLVWRAFHEGTNHRGRWLIASGLALGCSFGFSYLPFYVPCIAGIITYFSWKKDDLANTARTLLINGLTAGIPFILCVALFLGIDPYPFNTQVTHHVVSSAVKTPLNFVLYYLHSLWNFETPILLGAFLGFAFMLYKKRYKLLGLFGLFFGTVVIPMYIFLPNIDRYLVALLPMFSLMAAFGIYSAIENMPPAHQKMARLTFIYILIVYSCIVFIRYDFLLLQNDTRIEAKQWIESELPSGSTVILNSDSDRLRLSGTSASIAEQDRISSSSLRASDRVLLSDDHYAPHPFRLFTLHNATAADQTLLVHEALAHATSSTPVYLIEDAWATTTIDVMLPNRHLIKEFIGSSAIPNIHGLFIGGDTSDYVHGHLLWFLYTLPMLGPDVMIYEIGTSTPAHGES